jgi:hypothetical protein
MVTPLPGSWPTPRQGINILTFGSTTFATLASPKENMMPTGIGGVQFIEFIALAKLSLETR